MLRSGRGEYMVILPYTSQMFKKDHGGRITHEPRFRVVQWLRITMGSEALGIRDCSGPFPWRHRVFQVNLSHAFFFRERRDAILFTLTWGTPSTVARDTYLGA